jgi:cation diffusion facilitator family transporter
VPWSRYGGVDAGLRMARRSAEGVARRRAGLLEGSVSIVVNAALFIVKYVLGVEHNSIAVVADSIHTLSDSLTSAVVIVGFRVSYKPADEEHPLGHGRAEAIATVIIGTLLLAVSFDFLQRSVAKLLSAEPLAFSWVLVAALTASTVVKEVLASWSLRLGRRYGAPSLVADAWHHRSDAIATALLALSIALGRELWWLDGVLGVAVSCLIAYTAVSLVTSSSRELLGRGPTRDEIERLREVVYSTSSKVADLHHIHVHRYGEHTEVTLHVRMDPSTTLEETHRVASEVERRIREELGWEATVHVEPTKAGTSRREVVEGRT